MLLLQGQDCGCDVESVENLIRRHEEMEREARVIQDRSQVRPGADDDDDGLNFICICLYIFYS